MYEDLRAGIDDLHDLQNSDVLQQIMLLCTSDNSLYSCREFWILKNKNCPVHLLYNLTLDSLIKKGGKKSEPFVSS